MGEGAGVLILEREDHAAARGATVYGRIVGYGASNDAFDMVQPDEFGAGALIAMRAALDDAGVGPRGDRLHLRPRHRHADQRPRRVARDPQPVRRGRAADLLDQVGDRAPARRGRLDRGAGLHRGAAARHPAADDQLLEPDPECDLDYLVDGAREAPGVRLALSNSFGFGGQNACLAIAAA
jgi:3-oxoacyl-[acyl-carrier-protein] synthase II